jgi:hypothetical protein
MIGHLFQGQMGYYFRLTILNILERSDNKKKYDFSQESYVLILCACSKGCVIVRHVQDLDKHLSHFVPDTIYS